MGDPIRVFVVDDADHVRRMLTTMLDIDGFEVVGGAAGGLTVVPAVVDAEPDVVVIDYKMPSINGLELAKRIRERLPDQHVILYTAFVDEAVERSAAEIGVAVCVGKVEGIGPLEQEIRRLAEGSRS